MKSNKLILCLALVLGMLGSVRLWAQSATVTYSLPEAIPVLGHSLLLLLGAALAGVAVFWLRYRPALSRNVSVALLGSGVVMAGSASLWFSQNTQAVAAATNILFSENSSPVDVTTFPAELTNDLSVPATLRSIAISGCSTTEQLTGTCSVGATLEASGGSCMIESICASNPLSGEVCFSSNEFATEDPWVICDINETEAWISADTGGTYNALAICQGLGYDTVGQQGGTCGNVCGYCEGTTSCENPGARTFDGGGGDITAMSNTVQWTCVNNPG